jgi:hypothetical protein
MVTPPVWRDLKQNYCLVGYRCTTCGFVSFPRKPRICIKCGKKSEFKEEKLSARGKVVTYVVQYYLPSEFETPLPMAIVDLENGGRIYAMVTECKPDEIHIGMEVELDFREILSVDEDRIYSYKCKPVR